jgi:hypothetical protein
MYGAHSFHSCRGIAAAVFTAISYISESRAIFRISTEMVDADGNEHKLLLLSSIDREAL